MSQLLFIIFVVFIFALMIGFYKSLKKLRSMSQESWGKVQFNLNAKYEIVSSLIEYLKTRDKTELISDSINNLIEARIKSIQAMTPFQKSLSEQSLNNVLNEVTVSLDSIDNIAQDQKYTNLKTNLDKIDTELLISTNYYNAVVSDLNSKVQSFPSGFLAGLFGISSEEIFRYDFFNNRQILNKLKHT